MTKKELKAHRKRLGLSLSKAASQVHVSVRTWARYESGERKVPEAIAHLFCLLNGIEWEPARKTRR